MGEKPIETVLPEDLIRFAAKHDGVTIKRETDLVRRLTRKLARAGSKTSVGCPGGMRGPNVLLII